MTPLHHALLGLIRAHPRSGYALLKVFETTPMGSYSSSPGSIYPALKSLEKAGLAEVRDPRDARGKGLYHITAVGGAALELWLHAPIVDLNEALLRFAFLPEEDGAAIRAFLDAFEAAAEAQAGDLAAFLASDAATAMTAKSRIAVEHGRCRLAASADWARAAKRHFSDE